MTTVFCSSIMASARRRSAMAAANAIAVMKSNAVELCMTRSDWFSVSMTNGPKLWSVPQMARAERMKMPVAVSRWVKRKAVQMTIGPQMKAIG
jgi:hypothetical protein